MLILCLAHFLCLLLITVGKLSGRLHISRSMFVITALVPVFGFLCMISAEFKYRDSQDHYEISDFNTMRIEDEVYRSITVDPDDDARRIIPVEESLLLNDSAQRRKLLLNVLSLGSSKFVPSLRKAGKNDDTEVVHYSVTALVELRKDYDDCFLRMERKLNQSANDPEVISQSMELLEEYIASGVPEKGELKECYLKYDALLSRAFEVSRSAEESARLLHKRAGCAMALEDYEGAVQLIDRLIVMEPEREEGYLLKIKCFCALKNRKGIDAVIRMIENNHVFLSEHGKKDVAFWQPHGVLE